MKKLIKVLVVDDSALIRKLLTEILESEPGIGRPLDDLPEQVAQHPMYDQVRDSLEPLRAAGNPYAAMLCRVYSGSGQGFIKTAIEALKKPADQEVVESLLDAIAMYFRAVRPEAFTDDDIVAIAEEAGHLCTTDADSQAVLQAMPGLAPAIRASILLSCLSVRLVNPIFARTDAIGTMMRKKIQPVTDPVFEQLKCLQA